MLIASFLFFLLGFIIIGLLSVLKRNKNHSDYLMAGQTVQPWLAGLSAVATNNSGYMFIGVIGYTYSIGLAAIWLMLGWIVGDFIASSFAHKKIRQNCEALQEKTFIGVLSRWQYGHYAYFRVLAGVLAILFLGIYAAAQLKAGSKALHVLFGWEYYSGAVIGAIIIVFYCFAGGIRASIWTDAAQSIVMLLAMAVLFFCSLTATGGTNDAITQMQSIPEFLDFFPRQLALENIAYGPFLFVIGWLFAGFSVIGQPHIMIRFMSIDHAGHVQQARYFYYIWFTLFYILATGVGMLSRLLLPETSQFDPELALPTIALQLLPDALVGLILAGIFAATMSTADSLILSCSASFTHDIAYRFKFSYRGLKVATVMITAFALLIALTGNANVFSLVIVAWAMLAAAYAPLLTLHCFKQQVSQKLAIAMMGTGTLTVFIFHYYAILDPIYEGMPGILVGFIVFLLTKYLPVPVSKLLRSIILHR